MLKSIQSNNSPGHSHNGQTPMVDLSTDFRPGVLLKRNKTMNKPQVKIETFKKINGEIQIDYNGAYVGSLRPSPPWFKEDGIDTESIANLIALAPKTLALLKEMATDENELRFALCRLFGTKKGNSLSRQIKDLIAKAEVKS